MDSPKYRLFFSALCVCAAVILFFSTCKKEDNPPTNCPDCPSVTALTPNFGSPGDTITLSGKNFGGLQSVQFNGEGAIVLDGATGTVLKVIAPNLNKTGAADVLVVRNFQSPSGGTAVLRSEAVAFTYAPEKATISSLTPNSGTAGTVVTILGQRFNNVKAVRFNGVDAAIQTQTPTQLVVVAPTVSVTGLVEVLVVTQFDLNGALQENPSSSTPFTYDGNFGILDFNPKIGKKDDLVTISGFGFGTNPGAIQVQFNGKSAEVVSVTDTEVRAKVPVRAGDGKIKVIKNAIAVFSGDNFSFEYSYVTSTVLQNQAMMYDIDSYNSISYIVPAGGSSKVLIRFENGTTQEVLVPENAKAQSGAISPNGNYIVKCDNGKYYSLFGNFFTTFKDGMTIDSDDVFDFKFIDENTIIVLSLLTSYEYSFVSKTKKFIHLLTISSTNDGPIPVGGIVSGATLKGDTIIFSELSGIRQFYNNYVSTLSGSSDINDAGHQDGVFANARFRAYDVVFNPIFNALFVADGQNNCIRKLDFNTGLVSTIAGNSFVPGFIDSIVGTSAKFNHPGKITIDANGNLLIVDQNYSAIRKITIE